MIIREAKVSDIQHIYLLNKNELGYDYPIEKMKVKINNVIKSQKDKLFVAVIEDQVVGYVHANDYESLYMDHMKNIMGIAVDHNYRHQGIGQLLLLSVEQWAVDTGAAGVRLVSGETRKDAHEFYKHCGYENKKKQLYFMKYFNKSSQ